MPHQWISAVRTSLLLRSAIATFAGVVMLLGVNSALSMGCFAGLGACEAPIVALDQAIESEPAAEPVAETVDVALAAMPEIPAAQATSNASDALTLSRNDVIAKTFATLAVELTAPQAIDVGRASAQAVDEDAEANQTELTKRVVRTIAIKPDGTPDLGQAAPVVAVAALDADAVKGPAPLVEPLKPLEAKPAVRQIEMAPASSPPVVAETEAPVVAETEIAALTPGEGQRITIAGADAFAEETAAIDAEAALSPAPKPRPTAALAYAPSGAKTSVQLTDGNTATVGGQGVNVRSAPSKSKSKVLFALTAGTEVTITDSEKGWQYVTDGKGRSGWAYKDLLLMR